MEAEDPAITRRRDRVYVAVSDRLPGLGDPIRYFTLRYGGEFGDRLHSAGGVPLVGDGLSVVFSLALHGPDVFVTITEGPIEVVANVLCDLDAYSSSIAWLGARATFAPDNERLLAAGYEAVLVVRPRSARRGWPAALSAVGPVHRGGQGSVRVAGAGERRTGTAVLGGTE